MLVSCNMRRSGFAPIRGGLVLLLTMVTSATAAPVTIKGSLRDTQNKLLSGRISVFREVPHFNAAHHRVTNGTFEFTSDSQGSIVIHATAEGYPSREHMIQAGATGTVLVDFTLPVGQDVRGRVVDINGNGIPGATVQVRYYEPDKPPRRVRFDLGEQTDGDGQFLLHGVGVNVPFYIDVHAPSYLAKTSELLKLKSGRHKIDSIVLSDPVSTVIVTIADKNGSPVPEAEVVLLADPSRIPTESLESWIHDRSFAQDGLTSRQGNVRFAGVPPGHITVQAKTTTGVVEKEFDVLARQEHRITLVVP